MPGYIHHIEWSVKDLTKIANLLVKNYGFVKYARRLVQNVRQEVVKSGTTIFLLTERRTGENVQAPADTYPMFSPNKDIDTLFNICVKVDNVDKVTETARSNGAQILDKPMTIENQETGSVRISVIKSCVGNVIHSIVSTEEFHGDFLPGFELYETIGNEKCQITQSIDHVTYVCEAGQSDAILEWYGKCFGMQRFLVNPAEDFTEGIVIEEEVGLRMKVGEWISSWLCREVGTQFRNGESCGEDVNFKLVLAEPLPNRTDTHVQKFLDEHGGPGIQHIGLSTNDIEKTVEILTNRGASFRRPPPTYYKLESKLEDIKSNGFSVSIFERLGLLLDSEADIDDGEMKALVQIFTKPIFKDKDTFFLEVLQRKGARGFGAGNIMALARSILLYQKEMNEGRI